MKKYAKMVLQVAMVSVILVALAGADAITCIPAEPEEPVCMEAKDCEGMPHIMCVGYWGCEEGECVWNCGSPPIENPCVDEGGFCALDKCPNNSQEVDLGGCPTGNVCCLQNDVECVGEGQMGSGMIIGNPTCCPGLQSIAVSEWNPGSDMCMMMMDVFLCAQCGNGECESEWENFCNCPVDCPNQPTGGTALCIQTGGAWNGCGSGCGPWSCGEPPDQICPAVCIPQCDCPSDAPGWDPVEGCVPCSCNDWYATYQGLVKDLAWCTSADQCVSVPGTSCGCTHNLVVNKNAELYFLWSVTDQMGEAGCSPFVSTCDCPAADGFVCNNNQCGWNYL